MDKPHVFRPVSIQPILHLTLPSAETVLIQKGTEKTTKKLKEWSGQGSEEEM